MRAPPESLMPMIGIRLLSARSITLITFSAKTSPSEPPKTLASWLNSITSRPSILAMPVTTPSPGSLEMGRDVVDVHQHAVDDVRHLRPSPRGLALLAMPLGAVVVGRRSSQHDQPLAGLHLAMTESAVSVEHPRALAKAKSLGEPAHRRGSILVSEHRNHGRITGTHAASPGRYSPKTPRRTRQHSPTVT